MLVYVAVMLLDVVLIHRIGMIFVAHCIRNITYSTCVEVAKNNLFANFARLGPHGHNWPYDEI